MSELTRDADDPRVAAGMKRQNAERETLIANGAKLIGWKAGVGAPGAREALSTNGPLAGFLTDATLAEDNAAFSLANFTNAALECEIAVYIGKDLPADPRNEEVADAISALGLAFELVDLSPPPTDVEEVVAGNIYHQAVILGAKDEAFAGGVPAGLEARAWSGGEEVINTSDLEGMTGNLIDVTRIVAEIIGTHSIGVHAGDVIIAGSITAPPLFIKSPQEVRYQLGAVGELKIRFEA